MATATTETGRWYPCQPPSLPGEGAGAYTDGLTGADGTNRSPYDHARNRQCSIGYHTECSDPAGETCKCPCHTAAELPEADIATMPEAVRAAGGKLAELYDLPLVTG